MTRDLTPDEVRDASFAIGEPLHLGLDIDPPRRTSIYRCRRAGGGITADITATHEWLVMHGEGAALREVVISLVGADLYGAIQRAAYIIRLQAGYRGASVEFHGGAADGHRRMIPADKAGWPLALYRIPVSRPVYEMIAGPDPSPTNVPIAGFEVLHYERGTLNVETQTWNYHLKDGK